MALRSPPCTWTIEGPGWPSRGTEPTDLVTTPPAPAAAARRREAPVVPRMPAARRTGLARSSPPAWMERDGMNGDILRQDKRLIKEIRQATGKKDELSHLRFCRH